MLRYIALPIVGFVVGLLVISLGGGGGAVYVGILTAFFGISPAIAASTSLATIIPTSAVGTYSHWKAGNVNFKYGFTMLIGGVIGCVAGSFCSRLLSQSFYNKLTGVILLLLCVQMFISFLNKRKHPENTEIVKGKKSDTVKAVIFGILGGAMAGLIGLSGGAPIIAGLSILGCGALETVGTSILVLLGISVVGFLLHLGLGNVEWRLVGLLIIGTVTGAFIGPIILKHIDKKKLEKALQPILLVMLTIMGVILLFK
ncbi:MAG: sulfite exporter TauE/SafE family protein [Clostridia bacterium]|jgi:uncharacterized membrane protein YfcA|nr:sulfite exporter TauE/SafE family protein [Clostridia bacterium]